MLEALESLLKELQKNNQKVQIQTIGMANKQALMALDQKVQQKGKEEIKEAKKSVLKSNHHLQEAIKGQFGQKVTQVLEKQEDVLTNF